MTALTIVQDVQSELGLNQSSAIEGTLDNTAKLLLALLNREGRHLVKAYNFQTQVRTASLTTLAAEDQGAIATIAPSGFARFVPDTMYDETADVPVLGPDTGQQWRWRHAHNLTGPYSKFRVINNHLYFYPAPSAGHTVKFEYLSKNWCEDNLGVDKEEMTADDDVELLDHDLLVEGVTIRYLQRNGLPFDTSTYIQTLAALLRADVGAGAISAEGSFPLMNGPGVFVPRGPW